MAQFFTNFSEYTVGTAPGDFTSQFSTSTSLEVVDNAGVNELEFTISSGSRSYWAWDDVGTVVDVEIYVLQRLVAGTTGQLSAAGRISGSLGNETAFRGHLGLDDILSYDRYIDGANNREASTVIGDAQAGELWHIVFRINGTNVEVKAWKDGDTEPVSPQVTATDADLDTKVNGLVGFGGFNAATYTLLKYGVGTSGDVAPRAPVSGSPNEVTGTLSGGGTLEGVTEQPAIAPNEVVGTITGGGTLEGVTEQPAIEPNEVIGTISGGGTLEGVIADPASILFPAVLKTYVEFHTMQTTATIKKFETTATIKKFETTLKK